MSYSCTSIELTVVVIDSQRSWSIVSVSQRCSKSDWTISIYGLDCNCFEFAVSWERRWKNKSITCNPSSAIIYKQSWRTNQSTLSKYCWDAAWCISIEIKWACYSEQFVCWKHRINSEGSWSFLTIKLESKFVHEWCSLCTSCEITCSYVDKVRNDCDISTIISNQSTIYGEVVERIWIDIKNDSPVSI